ncbi:hypothetical protein SRHO_G00052220 [Serrasalmus rhombeus]
MKAISAEIPPHSLPEHSLLIGRSFLSHREPSVRLTSHAKQPVSMPLMSSCLWHRKCQMAAARGLQVQHPLVQVDLERQAIWQGHARRDRARAQPPLMG